MAVTGTTVSGNVANDPSADDGQLGGLALQALDGTGSLTRSTISGNATEGDVGGLLIVGPDTLVQDSTISSNQADSNGDGAGGAGGLSTNSPSGGGSLRVINSTVANNSAAQGGGVALYGYEEPLELSSTIVGDNSAPDGPDLFSGSDGTNTAPFDIGHSLVENTSGALINEAPAGSNRFGVAPQLGALANNGGPTQTQLPALSSPAIDAGVANGLATDQRGLPRTSDLGLVANFDGSDGTDIGATEIQAADVEADCQGVVARKFAGTEAGETITGTEGPDAITGAGGDDTLQGLGANDCLSGDAGNDTADGGDGNDLITGGDGNDNLKGVGGKDNLNGAGGKDKKRRRRQGQDHRRRRQGQAQGLRRKGQGLRRRGQGQDQPRQGQGQGQGRRRQGQDQHRRRQEGQAQLRRRQGQGQGRRKGQGQGQLRRGEGQGQ